MGLKRELVLLVAKYLKIFCNFGLKYLVLFLMSFYTLRK